MRLERNCTAERTRPSNPLPAPAVSDSNPCTIRPPLSLHLLLAITYRVQDYKAGWSHLLEGSDHALLQVPKLVEARRGGGDGSYGGEGIEDGGSFEGNGSIEGDGRGEDESTEDVGENG